MGRLKLLGARVGTLEPRVKQAPKVADSFYTSPEWRGLVARLKKLRGNRCERPGCGSAKRVIGDHIVERRDGGADLDPRNIELLCFDHHQAKTADARRRRARGQG